MHACMHACMMHTTYECMYTYVYTYTDGSMYEVGTLSALLLVCRRGVPVAAFLVVRRQRVSFGSESMDSPLKDPRV